MLSQYASERLKVLGERLRDARLNRDETQKRFAARLGVSIPTYQKLEKGNPTVAIGLWFTAFEILDRLSDVDGLLAEKESLFNQFETRVVKKRQRATKRTTKK
jgi:transcriptional regulator with XRE-family HTH domain